MVKQFTLFFLLLVLIRFVSAEVTAIKTGNLIDPETAKIALNQVILIEDSKIISIGENTAIPADATIIDLTNQFVLPGIVDAHDHLQTPEGALRAIEAGFWSIEHSGALDDKLHKLMVERGIWRVGTETPQTDYHPVSDRRWEKTVAGLKNAYENKVKMAFSTDADYFAPGLHRGEITINFLKSWKAAEIPAPKILKIMTINGYKVCDIESKRGPIKVGFPADIITVSANQQDDIDALRDVTFVMKDGMVFKQNGEVIPMKFFHSGPEYGWRKC